MGCGLPYAIGSSISLSGAPVYCVAGDGGFQMNIQELETVRRELLPIKIVVLNNRVLGKIYETQRGKHGRRFAQTAESGGYTVPDLHSIAEAYGIRAASLDSYEELSEYSEWLLDREPCLLNVALGEDSYLEPKINWSTGAADPPLPNGVSDSVRDILNGR